MDTKKTIMVVDDNPDIITIVKTILEGKGYNVLSASSGAELLNLLKNQKPDLIILDIMMPEMDGLEVLTRLKGMADTTSIPIILLTAKVQYEDVLGGTNSALITTSQSRLPAHSLSTASICFWGKARVSFCSDNRCACRRAPQVLSAGLQCLQ